MLKSFPLCFFSLMKTGTLTICGVERKRLVSVVNLVILSAVSWVDGTHLDLFDLNWIGDLLDDGHFDLLDDVHLLDYWNLLDLLHKDWLRYEDWLVLDHWDLLFHLDKHRLRHMHEVDLLWLLDVAFRSLGQTAQAQNDNAANQGGQENFSNLLNVRCRVLMTPQLAVCSLCGGFLCEGPSRGDVSTTYRWFHLYALMLER